MVTLDQSDRHLDSIGLNDQQIARPEATEARRSTVVLASGFGRLGHATACREPLLQEPDDLAVGPAALAAVLEQMDPVEGVAEDLALADNVVVAPVAGGRVDDRPARSCGNSSWPRPTRRGPRGCARSRRRPSAAGDLKHVETAGRLLCIAENDSRPARIASAGKPKAQAAAVAASTFSTWKPTRPPCVSGTSAERHRAASRRSPSASTITPSRTNDRPAAAGAVRGEDAGARPSRAKKITEPGQCAAIAATSGSSAFSTAAPVRRRPPRRSSA